MLIFVDYEHADRYTTDEGRRIQAARTWITYRLEDVSGLPCMLVRYDRLTPELVDRIGATALFISGNGSPPSAYDPADVEPLAAMVRESRLPMFGFCGGWQVMAEALGSPLLPIEVTETQAASETITTVPSGAAYEFGYFSVDVLGPHPLLDGLGDAPVFRHAHGLHIADPPTGFATYASTDVTPVQVAIDDERRMVGTQFHPEYWTDEHPAGRRMIANFLRWIDR